MTDALGTLERAALVVGKLLRTLIGPLDSAQPGPGLKALAAGLGWTLPDPVPPSLIALKSTVAKLTTDVDQLTALIETGADDTQLATAGAEAAASLVAVVTALGGLPAALTAELPAAFVAATNLPDEFAPRLLDALIVDELWSTVPMTARILRLAGLIEISDQPADPAVFQPAYQLRRIHYERIGQLLSDPAQVFADVYGWGTPTLNLQPLQEALSSLAFGLGIPGTYDYPSPGLLRAVAPAVAAPKAARSFEFVLYDDGIITVDTGVTAIPTAAPAEPQGAAVILSATGDLSDLTIPLGPDLTLTISASIDASAGIALALRPGQPPALSANYDATLTEVLTGKLTSTLSYTRADGEDPFIIIAFPGGSQISARQAYLSGGLDRTGVGALNPVIEGGVKQGTFSLSAGQADGFLAQLLPPDGLTVNFDLGVGWSKTLGIYLSGNAGLEISLPLHVDLGPLSLQWLFLSADLTGGALALTASVSGTGSLGPLSAAVDRIGLTAVTTFPPGGGNVGPANLALAFKPPNGVGLSVDAGIVSGGGYLYIDTARGEYAGAVQLSFADFLTLNAIGLIDTKLPDGSTGFSLLIIITADFGSGLQLGFGFTLNGVGGLLGVNRAMLLQPLMDGVRTGAIEGIMFPHDIVANAPRIISDLRAIFPPQQGTFLIGPMAKLGWGEPTLVSLSLGVIVEIPPGDIAIVGTLQVELPADEDSILVLQVVFAGALEFDKQRLYFFASLFDSHILFITIEGEMGLLFAWGDAADFVVTVGGFHPQFSPPPLPFSTPKRISLDIINESDARIRGDAYFAITTNTAQFGTQAEFFFGFSALSVTGHAGFDALFQFSPFHFSVSISASFSVQVFGLGVFGLDIDLTLEGPTPWHAHGTASLSFLFFSIGVGIDITWGDANAATLPPVNVMPLLAAEFAKQSNWRAVLPPGSNLLVSLRALDPAQSQLVLHPVGTLQVSQRAVPLDLTVDTVGSQQPADANRFTLSVASADLVRTRTLTEPFAPAQFTAMADAAKLSQPAYEPLDSGLELAAASGQYASGTAIVRIVRYAVTIIDTKLRRASSRFTPYPGSLFQFGLRGNAAARSAMSAARQAQTHPFEGTVGVSAETFAVARTSDNTVYHPDAAMFTSQAGARDYLSRAVAADPALAGTLRVLPQFEVAP